MGESQKPECNKLPGDSSVHSGVQKHVKSSSKETLLPGHAALHAAVLDGDKPSQAFLLSSLLIVRWGLQSPNRGLDRGGDGTQRTGSTAAPTGKDRSLRIPSVFPLGSRCVQELGANRGGEPEDCPAFVGSSVLSDCQGGACSTDCQPVPLTPLPSTSSGAFLGAARVPRASQDANRSSHWALFFPFIGLCPQMMSPLRVLTA